MFTKVIQILVKNNLFARVPLSKNWKAITAFFAVYSTDNEPQLPGLRIKKSQPFIAYRLIHVQYSPLWDVFLLIQEDLVKSHTIAGTEGVLQGIVPMGQGSEHVWLWQHQRRLAQHLCHPRRSGHPASHQWEQGKAEKGTTLQLPWNTQLCRLFNISQINLFR